jgi:hypothetical protein
MTTLDHEWRQRSSPRVSCLKIDVEGAEPYVLLGAEQIIARDHPHILMEWHSENLRAFGTEPEWIVNYAKERDYGLAALMEPSVSCVNVTDRQGLMRAMQSTEMFLLIPRCRAGSLSSTTIPLSA